MSHPQSHLLPGTWRFVRMLKRTGEEVANVQSPGNYAFSADGRAAFQFKVGGEIQMRWKIVEGKLCFYMPRPLRGRSTHSFEFADAKTLIIYDRYGRRMFFSRLEAGSAIEGSDLGKS